MKKESIKALHKAKQEFGKLIKNKMNPFHKSKYADLNALLETVEVPLREHGFEVFQPIVDNKVITRIIEIESGETVMESDIKLPDISDPQKIGSAVTYYRRYTLQSMLGINASDDDGNAGRGKKQNKPQIKRLNREQFDKLKQPANHKYIEKYLNTYEMSDIWRQELRDIANSYNS